MVDAFQLGDLQIERGAEFRQVRRVTSQFIEFRELAMMRVASRIRCFDLVGQGLHLPPVGRQPRLHPRTLAGQSTPQLLLVRRGSHPEILQSPTELIVEFRSAPNFSDEAPGSGQARQAGPSLRLELHPALPPWGHLTMEPPSPPSIVLLAFSRSPTFLHHQQHGF
jgi:hypothetical protein